jgi:hypothetical protein
VTGRPVNVSSDARLHATKLRETDLILPRRREKLRKFLNGQQAVDDLDQRQSIEFAETLSRLEQTLEGYCQVVQKDQQGR